MLCCFLCATQWPATLVAELNSPDQRDIVTPPHPLRRSLPGHASPHQSTRALLVFQSGEANRRGEANRTVTTRSQLPPLLLFLLPNRSKVSTTLAISWRSEKAQPLATRKEARSRETMLAQLLATLLSPPTQLSGRLPPLQPTAVQQHPPDLLHRCPVEVLSDRIHRALRQ